MTEFALFDIFLNFAFSFFSLSPAARKLICSHSLVLHQDMHDVMKKILVFASTPTRQTSRMISQKGLLEEKVIKRLNQWASLASHNLLKIRSQMSCPIDYLTSMIRSPLTSPNQLSVIQLMSSKENSQTVNLKSSEKVDAKKVNKRNRIREKLTNECNTVDANTDTSLIAHKLEEAIRGSTKQLLSQILSSYWSFTHHKSSVQFHCPPLANSCLIHNKFSELLPPIRAQRPSISQKMQDIPV